VAKDPLDSFQINPDLKSAFTVLDVSDWGHLVTTTSNSKTPSLTPENLNPKIPKTQTMIP